MHCIRSSPLIHQVILVAINALALVACQGDNERGAAHEQPATERASNGARGPINSGEQSAARERNAAPTRGTQPPVTVVTAVVREAPFATEVEALGTAKANEAIDVTAKVSSRVTAIRFREGQFVRRGDVLIELDADEAQADLAVAEATLSDSRGQFDRARELAATQVLSAQQLEQLEAVLRANEARVAAARARLDELTIRAPFAGRVGLRNVSVGSLVNPGTVITTLDDISVMKLDFAVPETFLSILSEGLEVEASSAAYAGEVFKGRVISVGSRVDPISRSITVRAQVPNHQAKLKPGMFMTVRLQRSDERALVIPEQALVPERNQQFVFAVRNNQAVKTEVIVGRRRPGEVEVLRGLQVGDPVIIEGTQKVRDGVPVRLAAGQSAGGE